MRRIFFFLLVLLKLISNRELYGLFAIPHLLSFFFYLLFLSIVIAAAREQRSLFLNCFVGVSIDTTIITVLSIRFRRERGLRLYMTLRTESEFRSWLLLTVLLLLLLLYEIAFIRCNMVRCSVGLYLNFDLLGSNGQLSVSHSRGYVCTVVISLFFKEVAVELRVISGYEDVE